MTATTIKVDSALRDRLNEAARNEGMTAGSFVESLFDEWLRKQRFVAIRDAMARTTPDEWASYTDDLEAWDAAVADGLGQDPGPHQ